MKRAKKNPLKPRNPIARDPLMGKGGAHQRRDKRACRARLEDALRRQLAREDERT